MKLRTTHNSIRIRIRKSELALLKEYHTITESVAFPTGIVFSFSLAIEEHQSPIKASFDQQQLKLTINTETAEYWMTNNQVGIESYIDLTESEQLHILIEKDFPCKDRLDEDKSDTFEELAEQTPDAC